MSNRSFDTTFCDPTSINDLLVEEDSAVKYCHSLSMLGRIRRLNVEGKLQRLGIMGGTFDPIHLGHLLCAEQAREGLKLDAILFIPAGVPSFKRGKVKATSQQRLDMTRLAIEENPFFDMSDIEVKREGTTYTVDTLLALKEFYNDVVELFFITGSDSLKTITSWYRSDEMKDLATFVGVSRPGYEFDDEPLRQAGFSYELLTINALHISSSDIRQRRQEGLSIRYLAPATVVRYIHSAGLYDLKSPNPGDETWTTGHLS